MGAFDHTTPFYHKLWVVTPPQLLSDTDPDNERRRGANSLQPIPYPSTARPGAILSDTDPNIEGGWDWLFRFCLALYRLGAAFFHFAASPPATPKQTLYLCPSQQKYNEPTTYPIFDEIRLPFGSQSRITSALQGSSNTPAWPELRHWWVGYAK